LWLDHGVRFVVVGIAAGFGARRPSGSMRTLADASDGLCRAIAGRRPISQLDEAGDTLEVRGTAHVFNTVCSLRTRSSRPCLADERRSER